MGESNLNIPPVYKGRQNKPIAEYIIAMNTQVLRGNPHEGSPGKGSEFEKDSTKYGVTINEPISEAEKAMHELWLARRQQEVCISVYRQ